jgi:DNA-binding SARP family transcriptional activator/tetratricopeptide (TPR) repeat protein
MRFRVLGPLRAESEGRQAALGGPRQRAVLAALLTAPNETLSRARLTELVWDKPNPSAEANLRGYVWKLRTALREPGEERPRILWDRGFRIRVEPGELDAWEFDLLAAQARRDRDAGRTADAADAYGKALALCSGEPFQDVEGSTRFEGLRTALRERRERVVEQYIELRMSLGEHADLISELRDRHARQPLWEHLAAQLMLALARSGRRGEALEVYRDTRAALVETLGTEPDSELQEVHRRVLRGESGPEAPRPASMLAPVDQLPFDLSVFTGRDSETALLNGLKEPGTGVAVVSGPAGVGKTSLAVRWAHRAKDAFPDGRLYVDLRGFTPGEPPLDPGEALRRLLEALGTPAAAVPAGTEQRAARFRELLADKRMLVVVDNAKDPAQARPLLPGAPGCRVIVTSRSRLTGLIASTGAMVVAVETMDDEQARPLLAARLGAARLDAEPEAVQRILDVCAGLPLALAVVAARAAARPEDPLDLLADELCTAATPLDSLHSDDPATDPRSLLRWSYEQLGEEAARLLRFLGLHPHLDWSAPAAASLLGAGLERTGAALAELVEANLLRRRPGRRYGCHDLVLAFADEVAPSPADSAAAVERMLDHYLHTAVAASFLLNPHRDPIPVGRAKTGAVVEPPSDGAAAMAWMGAERAALMAAVRTAAAHGFDAHCWQLAWSLHDYLLRRGRRHDQAAVWRTGLDAADRLGDTAVQTRAHRQLAQALAHLGRREEAREHLEQALRKGKDLDNPVDQAHTLQVYGVLWHREGAYAEAIDYNRRALDCYRTAGHRAGQAGALNSIGWILSLSGDHEAAIACCEQALALMRSIGHRPGEAATSDSLGVAHHGLGQYDEAAAYLRRAVSLYRETDSRAGEAKSLTRLADVFEAAGDAAAAAEALEQALPVLEGLEHPDAAAVRARLDVLRGG